MTTHTHASEEVGFYPTESEYGGRIYQGIHLVEFEDGGTYMALGHVAPTTMLAALKEMFVDDGVADDVNLTEANVLEFKHGFGKFTHRGSTDDWYCRFTEQEINTTPITVWTV